MHISHCILIQSSSSSLLAPIAGTVAIYVVHLLEIARVASAIEYGMPS